MAGLKNKYYVLRHGRSIPNEEGLIVSLMVCYFFLIPLSHFSVLYF